MRNIKEVKNFWEQHLCNEFYTEKKRGSNEYFAEIEKKRYSYQYHLTDLFKYFRKYNARFKDKNMLEIGCGMGMDSIHLYRCGFKLTAIDLTEVAIKVAKERAKKERYKINFHLGNAEKLKFKDESFDYIWSHGVLHHTPNIKKAVDEIYRVLKKNGTAYIILYSKYSFVNFIHQLFNIPYEMPKNMKDHCPVVYTFSKKNIKRLFNKFKIVKSEKKYPFTWGFRYISYALPMPIKRLLGKIIGWLWIIEVKK